MYNYKLVYTTPKDVIVIPVSSAVAERAFSRYGGMLNNLQKKSLQDTIESNIVISMKKT